MSTPPMFPSDTFAPREHHFQPWFAKRLEALEEQPIHVGATQLTIRFLWLRTYANPLVVRITRRSLDAKLTQVLRGGVIYRELRPLLNDDILDHFKTLEFWHRPEPVLDRSRHGNHLLLEAAKPGQYRALHIHAPLETCPLRRFCLAMVGLTRIKLPHKPAPRTGRRIIVCRAEEYRDDENALV